MSTFKPSSMILAFLALCIPNTLGNPYIISDSRVRSLDVTPVLGRGYSVMNNSFQSTCLDVKQTTIPSFNYEYEFYEFESSTESLSSTSLDLKASYSFDYLDEQVRAGGSGDPTSDSTSYFVVAMMKIERYYAGVREDKSMIMPSAQTLLDRQDYVGFFKACGPNYVRGIRRAQEVTAIFNFQSSSSDVATQYTQSLQTNYGYSDAGQSQLAYQSINKSLTITIKAYGLGLTEQGSESLLATSLGDFNKVMKFAYNQMTKSPYANHVGMVRGIELAPWIENVQFQIAAKITDEPINIPQPKSLIPVAYRRDGNSTGAAFNNDADTGNRDDFRCKDLTYSIDKYGYCCESGSLYDYIQQTYDGSSPDQRVCRPVRSLDPSIIKENVVSNGEFVARLESTLRSKMNMLSTLEKCISSVNGIPVTYDHYFLSSQDPGNYDKEMDNIFTVFDMRMSIDPFGDFAMVKHMAQELDEFIEMYYSPCLGAIFGSNIGTSPTTEPSYFMAYPWHAHKECNYLQCLANGMRWDRENGGCTPGLLSGSSAKGYSTSDDNCAKDPETNECKSSSEELRTFHTRVTNCWSDFLPSGSVTYFVEHFCMPKMSGKHLDDSTKAILDEAREACQTR